MNKFAIYGKCGAKGSFVRCLVCSNAFDKKKHFIISNL